MEWKRIVNRRNVLLLFAVMLVNLIVFGYGIVPGIKSIHESKRVSETAKTPEEKRVIKQKRYIKEYEENIQGVIDRAKKLKEHPLFSDPNRFSYNNIVKTEKDYEPLLYVELTLDNNMAVEELSKYFYTYLFSFVLIVFLINSLYSERDNGMWQMIHAAPKGRLWLALQRVAIVLFVSLVVCGVLYWSTVLLALISMNGFAGLTAPLQNLEKFGKSTLLINMLEYLFLNFFWSFLAVSAMAMMVFAFMTIFRNRKNVLIGFTAFGIIEYLLYINIESNSVYKLFKHINAVNLLRMSDVCTTYNNVGFSTVVVGLGELLLAALAVVTLLSAAVSVLVAAFMKPFVKATFFTKISEKIYGLYQCMFARLPHIFKEIHKNIMTAKGVWAIAAVLFAAWYFSTTGTMSFSDEQNKLDQVYLSYGGKDYSYVENYITMLNNQLYALERSRAEAEKQYENGEISFEEYNAVQWSYQVFLQTMSAAREPKEKIEYLARLEETRGIQGYLMSDRGYEQIFGKESVQRECLIGIVLFVAIVLLSFGSVKLERFSGMESLANASYKGEKRHHCVKMISCMMISGVLCLCVCIIDYFNLFDYYGTPYPDAPIQSLMFMENVMLPVTVRQWMLIVIIVKCIISVVASAITYMVFFALSKVRQFGRPSRRGKPLAAVGAEQVIIRKL